MSDRIEHDLDLIQLPRHPELGEYDWFNIELNGTQVGKSRCRIEGIKLTVFSIMIYPEYEKHGFARSVIDFFKSRYPILYADRVRFTARDFWIKLGFTEQEETLFIWRRE